MLAGDQLGVEETYVPRTELGETISHVIRSERLTDEFLENRASDPGDGLGGEDEKEYCE